MMHWSAAYVGTPYVDHGRSLKGCDCWGLVCEIYRAELDTALPSYSDVSPLDRKEIALRVRAETESGLWRRVEKPQEYDVAVYRRGPHDSHVGIMIDARQMLHSEKQAGGAHVERIDRGRWTPQLVGFFRHRSLI